MVVAGDNHHRVVRRAHRVPDFAVGRLGQVQNLGPGVVQGAARYVNQSPSADDQDPPGCAVRVWWSLNHLAPSIRHVPVVLGPARHGDTSGPR